MSNVLVIAELRDGKLQNATLSCVTFARDAAQRSGGKVHALVMGAGVDAAAGELAKYVDVVHKADAANLGNQVSEAYAHVVKQAAEASGSNVIAMGASAHGKDLMPRVAALWGAGMASDITGFAGEGWQVKRPVQAGNIIATVEVTTDKKVFTTRPTEFDDAAPAAAAGTVQDLAADVGALKTEFVSFDAVKSERPQLTDASVVVSGGRGLKEAENFGKILEPLADKLGAAVGASRAIVDAGWVPNDMQVGQTGKVVAPDLYVAVGISGAIQHVAGMKGSKTIVAINKDPEAPIFQIADYGLVADLFKAVPELLEKL